MQQIFKHHTLWWTLVAIFTQARGQALSPVVQQKDYTVIASKHHYIVLAIKQAVQLPVSVTQEISPHTSSWDYLFVGPCLPCCPRDCRLWTMVEDFQVPFQDPGWEMAKAGHKYFYYSYPCGCNLDGGWVSSCFRQNLLKWLPYLFAELSRTDVDLQNEGRGGRLLSWVKWPRESSEDYFSARKFLRYLLGTHGIYSSDRLTNIFSNSFQMQVSPLQLLAYTLVF